MPGALGFIETQGLVAAIAAADIMLKTADVKLLGRELADAGLVTIEITGDTASVIAAVEAAAEIVPKVGVLISSHVILRPDNDLSVILPHSDLKKDNAPVKKGKIVPAVREQEKTNAAVIAEKPEKINVAVKTEKPEKPVGPVPGKKAVKEKPIAPENRVISEKPVQEKKIVKEKPRAKEVKAVIIEDKPQGSLFDVENDTIARLREEALGIKNEIEPLPVETKPEIKSEKEADKNKPVMESEISNLDELDVHSLRKLARSTSGFPIQGRQISKANRKQLIEYFKGLN